MGQGFRCDHYRRFLFVARGDGTGCGAGSLVARADVVAGHRSRSLPDFVLWFLSDFSRKPGEKDANWPDWYAKYIVAEQAGMELPQ